VVGEHAVRQQEWIIIKADQPPPPLNMDSQLPFTSHEIGKFSENSYNELFVSFYLISTFNSWVCLKKLQIFLLKPLFI
jgi:hypothetical protein